MKKNKFVCRECGKDLQVGQFFDVDPETGDLYRGKMVVWCKKDIVHKTGFRLDKEEELVRVK